jgi:hypothetical protein
MHYRNRPKVGRPIHYRYLQAHKTVKRSVQRALSFALRWNQVASPFTGHHSPPPMATISAALAISFLPSPTRFAIATTTSSSSRIKVKSPPPAS